MRVPRPRPYRLVAFDADAVDPAAACPTLARLLHAGAGLLAVSRARVDEVLARLAPCEWCGPFLAELQVAADGALFAVASGGDAVRLARAPDVLAAAAAERGLEPSDVLVIAARRGVLDRDTGPMAKERVPPEGVLGALRAQAALRPVRIPTDGEPEPEWAIVEEGFVLAREHEVESIFALGNGYVGTRASLAEGTLLSSPATFVAGVYGRRADGVPELVRLPDWAAVEGAIDGEPLRIHTGRVLHHRRTLDLRSGAALREWRHRDLAGRITRIRGIRLASQADRHLLMQSATLTPENYAGRITVRTRLSGRHVVTTRGGPTVAFAVASVLETPDRLVRFLPDGERTGEGGELVVDVEPGRTYRLDRVLSVFSSREVDRPEEAAARHLEEVLSRRGVDALVEDHRAAWRALWDEADVRIDGDPFDQTAIRFAIYHLFSSVHPEDDAVSIGARGLSGTGYAGHVFWDTEIYMLPFYTLTRPDAARTVLTYRHRTLDAARERAQARGFAGALYAWESADTGEDVTPSYVLAPDGKLVPVHAGEQEQHISADVAYGVWSYWHASGDDRFMLDAGLEILIETARFWASRVERGADGRRHLLGVMGPDEYHASIDDDAYTNGMARWNLEQAASAVDLLRARYPREATAVVERVDLRDDERTEWRRLAPEIYFEIDADTGLIEQFRGYFDLEDIDLSAHEPRQAPIDVLLGRERVRASQVIKQPDVLMLLYLLPERFPRRVHEACFRYYEPRTAHDSSLSPPIHAALAARLGDLELALRYFRQTAEIDLANNMGNAASGVHMAALGGLWQAVVFGMAGFRDGELVDPRLPPGWRRLCFGVRWRGRRLTFDLGDDHGEDDR